jgi:hypothetical protein
MWSTWLLPVGVVVAEIAVAVAAQEVCWLVLPELSRVPPLQ